MPASVLERAPTAELRPGQRDEDSLPPYELLDRILEAYVEGDQGREQMVAAGLPEDVVAEVIRLVGRAEYKRRQAPPGVRVPARPSAATAACRSRTVSPPARSSLASAPGEPRSATGRRGGPRRRSARRPRSRLCCRDGGRSRPRSRIPHGRGADEVSLAWPIATLPSSSTALWVAAEVRLSASEE